MKPDKTGYMLYDSIYIKLLKMLRDGECEEQKREVRRGARNFGGVESVHCLDCIDISHVYKCQILFN